MSAKDFRPTLAADKKMKTFRWNHEKNKQLQQERKISFDA
jgi:hypothetical protein